MVSREFDKIRTWFVANLYMLCSELLEGFF